MNSPSYILSLAVLYICALFAVAWIVDRRASVAVSPGFSRRQGLVYAMSLGVYCSSWTFYGAVGSATSSPWSHVPIFLGPILVFLLAWPLLRRLVNLGTRHRVTSIADYFGARFGKRQQLSMLVTVVATAAVLPYIALQFRALAQAWSIVAGDAGGPSLSNTDSGLAIAIVLGGFTVLFGARRLDGRERHRGMMSAIALESVVKLVAFLCVAMLALAYLRRPDIAPSAGWGTQSLAKVELSADFYTQILISAFAIFCLPRQFHVMVVEAQDEATTRSSRWLLPLYLILFMLLVVPVSLAGSHLFGASTQSVSPDTYVQMLPAALDVSWISLIAFVGGLSAATGMVIVATVSLAIMLTNEVAVPAMIRGKSDQGASLLSLGNRLRVVRQITILLILAAAWLVSTQLHSISWLTEIGFMSFLAAAQLAPGLLAGLYWRRAHGVAITAGLAAGLALWFYCLVLPQVLTEDHVLSAAGLFGQAWLRPQSLLSWEGPGPLSYAALWSLGVNTFLVLSLSWLFKPSLADARQAAVFMDADNPSELQGDDFNLSVVRAGQLRALLPPFLEESRLQQLWHSFEDRYQQRLLPADRLPLFAVREAESLLASVIGAASSSRVFTELTESRQVDFAGLASLVSEAGRQQTFNRDLLETTVESMLQGVSVVDSQLRLVAWNSRYETMFAYPQRLLYVGMPIARLYRFNAERGVLGVENTSIEHEVEKRLEWLRQGHPHRLERRLPDGRVIDIHGVPLPRGGFVTTYIDISDYREMVTHLEEVRLELEDRVATGSQSLSDANAQLRQENRLRAEAEAKLRDTGLSKSRFMSATSHDLLQPISAARLFVAALKPHTKDAQDSALLVDKIDQSLGRAEQLISELREVARLDSGKQQITLETFPVHKLLKDLHAEFGPAAQRANLNLRLRNSSLWLRSDPNLLYRALQNLLSNAIKYSPRGTVLLGVRRRMNGAEIQILDQGPGIPAAEQARVFSEFERLPGSAAGNEEGLGLGLAIVSRYANLLDLPLRLSSELSRGSLFSLTVQRVEAVLSQGTAADSDAAVGRLDGVKVVCIDNDLRIREAMSAMLTADGCEVNTVATRMELLDALRGFEAHVVVADFHLDDGDTGIVALQWVFEKLGWSCPCIMVSADDGASVRDQARLAGYRALAKPVNPQRLKALILALAKESDQTSD
ncbi:PAS-domain containing protein [Congregibacter variabilis]|uniref:histidine kinase n=1 Tax=Congregibacter variabilis TaxID=3081200 RepID=A0ABZ0I5S5_9GAMM|nr:PAS-domain containing protein [Congregibacter sp. IMCC43200]